MQLALTLIYSKSQPNENLEHWIVFRFRIQNSNKLILPDYTLALRQAGIPSRRYFWLLDLGALEGEDVEDAVWSRYHWAEPIMLDRIQGTLIVKLGNVTTPYD